MNKKLTDLFDMPDELPRLADAIARVEAQEAVQEKVDIEDTLDEIENDETVPVEQARNLITAIHTAQDLSSQLRKLKGDTDHASTMDDVIENAFDAYKDLLELGFNIDPKHAGPIFAESTNLLKLVKDAANDKVDTYVKIAKLEQNQQKIDLDRRKMELMEKKFDFDTNNNEHVIEGGEGGYVFDRNDLLKMLKDHG